MAFTSYRHQYQKISQISLLLQIQESFRSFHKERSISTLFRIANRYAKQVPIVKNLFHKYALDILKSAVECHTIAGAFSKSPSESVLYVEKGLQIEPDNMSLLVFGEVCVSRVRRRGKI